MTRDDAILFAATYAATYALPALVLRLPAGWDWCPEADLGVVERYKDIPLHRIALRITKPEMAQP
jgi:hypothetical protein